MRCSPARSRSSTSSRAFVKERDDVPEPHRTPVAVPARVTPKGLARLRARLATEADTGRRAALEAALTGVEVVDRPASPRRVGFGATVGFSMPDGTVQTFTIVDPAEADPRAGLIAADSPLAKALDGTRPGSKVVWHRPAGDLAVVVRTISYDEYES